VDISYYILLYFYCCY